MELDPGLSTGWDSAEGGPAALGLGRVLGGELAQEQDKALGARDAAAVDVALDTHAALGEFGGWGAGPDSVPDTDRAPKVAAAEDTGETLGSGIALGVDMDAGQEEGRNGAPEVGIAAGMVLDMARIAGVGGVDMGQHLVSGPGRRRRRRVVGHSSRSGDSGEGSGPDTSAGPPAWGSRARKSLSGA